MFQILWILRFKKSQAVEYEHTSWILVSLCRESKDIFQVIGGWGIISLEINVKWSQAPKPKKVKAQNNLGTENNT